MIAEDIVGKNYSSEEDDDDADEADKESSDTDLEPASKKKKLSPIASPCSPTPMSPTEVISETQKQLTELIHKKQNSTANNKR